jgi:hypothetical protein
MPVMVATSEDRIAHPGGRRQGELPVLFHLMDVSRQRRPAEAAPAVSPPVASIDPEPKTPDLSLSLAPAAPLAHPGQSTLSAELQAAWPAIAPKLAILPAAASPEPAVVECLHAPVADSPVAGPPDSEPTALAVASDETPPTPVEPSREVTPRSLLTPRRKSKTPASEDWFATHGKFIAMAFVVALLGTIYFARTTRRQAAPASNTNESPLAEHKLDVQLPPQATATTGAESTNKKPAGAETSTQIASAAAEPKVDLLPPTTPPASAMASTSNQSAPRGPDSLFVFPSSKPADERIASRPQDAVSGQSSAARYDSPASASAPASPAAYPSTSSPALPTAPPPRSSYPQTAAPPLANPGNSLGQFTPPVPSAPQAPTMPPPNYRSQFPLPPQGPAPQPQAWMPPPSAPPLPGSYQPQTNTALGPRYERTGSGPY